uniref:LysE family translocator n=1 Tax=Akkermansia sp. TaxID=1872421 RepID=UPI003AF54A1A
MEELIFAGILLLSQASPGPDQAFVTRSTLAYGFGAGVMAALGIGTGVVAHAALACTVGASVFHSPLGLALFCLASCWMLYLAWKIWPRGGKSPVPADGNIPPASSIYRDALLTNLMNPKATFFFVALAAPLLEKNQSASYAFFIGVLIVVTGTV